MKTPPVGGTIPSLPKRLAILGSTGSIGCNALEVVEHLAGQYRVVALSGHGQIAKLAEQAARHAASVVAVTDPEADLSAVSFGQAEVWRNADALVRIVERDDVDVVLAAVVGAAGMPAVLRAAELGKTIALANKEAMVVGGSLVIPAARRSGARILPVDSEHSAIFQAMLAGRRSEVRRVILTASGGPFRTASREQMERATPDDALRHPTWRMGGKVTIDSATLFNKALELIEACWLFELRPDQIDIVVHPESVVHSMVEFVDGSVIAQLSPPDMRSPIQYALTFPERSGGLGRRLDLAKPWSLRFEPPDPERFPAIRLAYRAAFAGGTAGAVLNAANEAAVAAFCGGRLPLTGISRVVEATMATHRVTPDPTLSELLDVDRWARSHAASLAESSSFRTLPHA